MKINMNSNEVVAGVIEVVTVVVINVLVMVTVKMIMYV